MVDAVLSRAGVDRLATLFVAHTHHDHALDAAYVAQQTGARLHGSVSTLNVGRGGGLTEDRLALYEPGKELTFGRFAVTILSSKHSPPVPGVTPTSARGSDYKEGGSFDMLIGHGDRAILVKPSANYVAGVLDGVRADVLFLATATLGNQDRAFQDAFYDQIVGTVRPRLVIPIHWDNFLPPLSERLDALNPNDLAAGFDFLFGRLTADNITFGIRQGYQSVLLFADGGGRGATPSS